MPKSLLRGFGLIVCACVIGSCNNLSQEGGTLRVLSADEALVKDAQEYANAVDVPVDEALERLEIQDAIGELDATLDTDLAETYAGLWIQHEPDFGIVVNTTGDAQQVLEKVADPKLAKLIKVKKVSKTLKQLNEEVQQILKVTQELGAKVDAGVNVFTNQAEVYVASDLTYNALQKIDTPLVEDAKIEKVDSLSSPTVSDFYGGLYLGGNGCTSGFTIVDNVSGSLGMTTAAHCGNYAFWGSGSNSVGLNEIRERYEGAYDVQWMKPTSNQYSLKPRVRDDTCSDSTPCYRIITGQVNRPEQPINAWVCAYGNATNFRCGYIIDKTFRPGYVANATNSWVRVARQGVDLSAPGDSGGPWYKGGSAFGINSGQQGDIAIYMAINYMDQGVNVRLLKGR